MAHAKMTGEVGVCMATSGLGAIHLLNGLYDAKLDHQPVVAIVGQQKTFSLGGHYQQEVDLPVLFKDVAGEYCIQVSSPPQVEHVIDRAYRIAQASRSVTCVIVPADVQEEPQLPGPTVSMAAAAARAAGSLVVVEPALRELLRRCGAGPRADASCADAGAAG